jgi:hypothetical protein
MKKLVWLFVLALLVVPAFAAITVTTSASGSLSFESRLFPTPVTFVPSASLSLSFALSGDTKSVGNITATISGQSGFQDSWDTSGTITFAKLGGLVDLSLNKGTLTVSGTKLVGAPLDSVDGIGVVVPLALLKVTAGYKPLSSDALSFTQGVLAVRLDATVAPATVWGLVSMSGGSTTFAVGGSVKPVPMVEAFAEYASIAPTYIVGATVTPVSGVSLYGHYQGNNTYKVSATVTTIPNVTVYGEFDSSQTDNELFGYVAATQSVPVGSLELGAGYKKLDSVFGGYARLKTPVGPATNTLVASYNFSVDELDANGWSRAVLVKDAGFSLVNTLSVSF